MRVVLLLVALLSAACSRPPAMNDHALYRKSLDAAQSAPAPAKDVEAAGVARFKALYADFSPANLKRLTREVYAEEAFFADPLKQVKGIEAVDAYFRRSAESIEDWKLVFEDESAHGVHRYYRWTMDYTLRHNARKVHLLGMSHVIYDARGKVLFHQDYYDGAEAVYEKIPLLGGLIRFVRRRL